MDKDKEDRYSQLTQAAKDAAFEAAEAMDRRDLKTFNELQDRATALRKEASRLKSHSRGSKRKRPVEMELHRPILGPADSTFVRSSGGSILAAAGQ